LEFDWKYDGPGLGKGGTGTLKADGKVADSTQTSRQVQARRYKADTDQAELTERVARASVARESWRDSF
jgi:hypothetical protein